MADTANVSINLEVYEKVGRNNSVEMGKLRETSHSMLLLMSVKKP